MTSIPLFMPGRMRARAGRVLPWLAVLGLAGCLREGEERALADLDVGASVADELAVVVTEGLAHVRAVVPGGTDEPGEIKLRASAPAFAVSLVPEAEIAGEWIVTVSNCMPDAVLSASADASIRAADGSLKAVRLALPAVELDGPRPTVRRWRLDFSELSDPAAPALAPIELAEAALRIEPPDTGDAAPDQVWRFAVMGDIQTAMAEVGDVFDRINLDPTLRFVVSTGDLVQRGYNGEYDLFEQKLENLAIPYYSTIGNHELLVEPTRWRERFGRYNLHFRFKGVAFSLVDSGSASIDPLVYEWLDGWLDDAADDVHLFFTHYPPHDPVGVRNGSFRSGTEANKLLGRLAAGNVDMTFYGHIHSYYAFANAGIPAYISGGGGAIPERWDGIGRHYLAVDVAAGGVQDVAVVRVD